MHLNNIDQYYSISIIIINEIIINFVLQRFTIFSYFTYNYVRYSLDIDVSNLNALTYDPALLDPMTQSSGLTRHCCIGRALMD